MNEPFTLAHTDRVILMHQGYQFDFLHSPDLDGVNCNHSARKPKIGSGAYLAPVSGEDRAQPQAGAQNR